MFEAGSQVPQFSHLPLPLWTPVSYCKLIVTRATDMTEPVQRRLLHTPAEPAREVQFTVTGLVARRSGDQSVEILCGAAAVSLTEIIE